jgi:hypothetical protein
MLQASQRGDAEKSGSSVLRCGWSHAIWLAVGDRFRVRVVTPALTGEAGDGS